MRKKCAGSFLAVLAVCAAAGSVHREIAPAFAEEDQSVYFEVAPDTPVVETGGVQRVIVRALVRPVCGKPVLRAPLAVALVLDKSGSMGSGGKLENAKRGVLEALKMLGQDDVAALVAYDGRSTVLVPPIRVGRDYGEEVFQRAVRYLQPGGSTALYSGLVTGAGQIRPFVGEGYIPRVVLLSDGIANVGPSSAAELGSLGRQLGREEMTITTIGLGLDYNEDLMTALAAESGGNAYFARRGEMLPEIFSRDMADAVTVTARKLRISLRCADGVRPLRVVGRPGTMDGGILETTIDNLYGTGEKYALFELELPQGDAGSSLDAAVVRLDYVDTGTGMSRRQEAPLRISFAKGRESVERNRDGNIVAQAAIARNAEIREEAVRLADQGKAGEAAKLLERRKEDLRQMAPSVGAAAPVLEGEAGIFDALSRSILSPGGLSVEERKKTVNDAYIQKNQQIPAIEIGEVVSGDEK